MKNPQVSIIIPSYNAEKYIERCLDSIERQTYRFFNVIVIDDCSNDGTYEKICNLRNKYNYNIQIRRNEKNFGPAISRNKGIMDANGEYIAFCDSDDWYEPNFLELMINNLIEWEADVSLCGYNVVSEKGAVEKRPLEYSCQPKTIQEALVNNCDSLCMMVVRAEIVKTTLLPNIRNGEDMAVIPLIIQKSKKVILEKECLYNYFRRSDSASQMPQINAVYSLIRSYDYLYSNSDKMFAKELEFIGIRNLLYSAEITLFSISYEKALANKILVEFEKKYPKWKTNKYMKTLPTYKKIFLKFIGLKWFCFAWIIATIRKKKVK